MPSYADDAGRWYADPNAATTAALGGVPTVFVPLSRAGDEIRRQEALTLDQRRRAEYDAETARQAGDDG